MVTSCEKLEEPSVGLRRPGRGKQPEGKGKFSEASDDTERSG